MRITLPLPPNMANARTHWAKKHRQQKAYRIRCTVAHPSRPRAPISPAIVDAKVYVWNLMDDDGLTARLKWPLDWLVQRDILVDDSPAHMRLGEVTQAIDRKNQRVELTVRAFINTEEVA
jgi:hypothetical protein